MKGKTVVITGGNSGIGFSTAEQLATQGASLILGCRNPEKASAAVEELRRNTGNEAIQAFSLDLASLSSVRAFAEEVQTATPYLDVLINNAGLMVDSFKTTQDGFEYQIGVNHLGHFLLTQCLLPSLIAAPEARVVTVASAIHTSGKINFEQFRTPPESYSAMAYYAQSKLANVLFARELARRYPKLYSYSLHPGVVGTDFGAKSGSRMFSFLWNMMKPFVVKPDRGARTSVFLASNPEPPEPNGGYFNEKVQPAKAAAQANDDQLAHKLWEQSERLVNS